MSSKSPRVTVLMPAYNVEKYIDEAIQSILSQSFSHFEFIIVNDCSTDSTAEIIKRYKKNDKRIKIINNQTNQKLAKSLNIGISKSTGKYIIRMDADDFSLPDRIEKQVKYMDENPDIGISGGTMELFLTEGKSLGFRRYFLTDREIRRHIFYYSPFSHPTLIIRKKIINEYEVFNPSFNPAEDYEFYLRYGLKTNFGNIPDTIIKYRVNPNSMTSTNTRNMEHQTLRIRKLYINNPKYNSSLNAKILLNVQLASINLIPPKIKVSLFNKLRNEKR